MGDGGSGCGGTAAAAAEYLALGYSTSPVSTLECPDVAPMLEATPVPNPLPLPCDGQWMGRVHTTHTHTAKLTFDDDRESPLSY